MVEAKRSCVWRTNSGAPPHRGPPFLAATGERGAAGAALEAFAVATLGAVCGVAGLTLEPLALGEDEVRSVTWIVWAGFPGRFPLSAVWCRGEAVPDDGFGV